MQALLPSLSFLKKTIIPHCLRFCTLLLFISFLGIKEVKGQNLTQSGFTGVIVPQYMGSGTSNRLPVMFRATVTGLSASTSYKYYVQGATNSTAGGGTVDFGTTNSGAGNPILLNTAGTTYSATSSPSITSAGNFETFTTDASGSYTGWFGFVNTGNARFTAGNTVYPSITISSGGSSTTIGSRRALDLGITVLAYSATAGATNGSFINSASSGTAKNIVALYDNVTGTGRPIYVTFIENAGITNNTSGFTTYSTSAGNWGALIPNSLTNGVRRIEQFSSSTGNAVNDNQDADGTWTTGTVNTTTSTNGLTAKTISGTDAPLNVATTVVLSSLNPAVSAATLTANSTNNPIYRFDLAATNANATLSSLSVTTTGNYNAADVSNMKLWYQSSSTFNSGTATLLSTISTPGTAGTQTFSNFTRQVILVNTTGYFFITVDISSSISSLGSTLGISAVTTSNIGLTSSSSFTGSTSAGGTQTIGSISSYSVTFNANGGSGNMANQTSSAAANLTSNSFTRTCYAFTGWNTAANGTGTAYADGANYPFTSSTTLYAQWTSQNQWTGSANNNWNNAGNWSCGNVPSATENVLINTGSPALDINYEVPATYTLTLSGTGTLTINPGNKLTITGAADFGNKLVTVAANASNTGAIVLNGGSLQNATNVALQQWFTAQRAWRMLSNPFTTSITGTSIASDNSGFSVNQSGTGDMVVYNSGTDAWSANTTIAANTCYGFFYKGLQSDFNGTPGLSNYSGAGPTASVFSVKGTINTGSVTITPSNASPNYTLVGNPFAAPVNSIALTGGGAAPYYFYQANSASTDSKVKSGAWIIASSNSSNTTTIPMMGLIAYQAPSTTSFTIPIAAINTASSAVSALFKTTAASTQLNIDLMKNNTLFDRCIVREDIDALAQSLDQKDLLKMENVTANIYTLTPAHDRLAVYTEPAFTQAIPLAISAPVGTYQFNIQNTMNTSADWYLIDNYTHQQQLLANNSTYTFDINNDAASKGSQRFELSKQTWTTSIATASNQESIQLLGNVVQDHIALQVDATIHLANYQLVDLRGAVLAKGTLSAGKQEIAMASFVSGMYLLHIQNDQQHSVYKITKY
jgi:hypothetical protein